MLGAKGHPASSRCQQWCARCGIRSDGGQRATHISLAQSFDRGVKPCGPDVTGMMSDFS